MKIRGLFHKLLKSKYNSHCHYYCVIKSCSRNVSKEVLWLAGTGAALTLSPGEGEASGARATSDQLMQQFAAKRWRVGDGTRRRRLHLNETGFQLTLPSGTLGLSFGGSFKERGGFCHGGGSQPARRHR